MPSTDAGIDILFDGSGVIKYVDFGASRMLTDRRSLEIARTVMANHSSAQTSVIQAAAPTANNTLLGTPMYMSPELLSNSKTGRRSAVDIWSLGCVVLEMATGRKPWEHLNNHW
jgi:mitogen-activated protein kinase kinase kinase